VLMYIGTILLFQPKIKAQANYDSLHLKEAKHFFKTVIFLDSYNKPNQNFLPKDSTDVIGKKLQSYGIKQFSLGFYTPLSTKSSLSADSSVFSNTHYLLTGNILSLKPTFDGLKQHQLIKLGVGLRIIRNSGKKGVWFIDISPFFTKDVTYGDDNGYIRLSNSFIYSHNFSEKFNLRAGITKSFLWGNRNYWPYLGFRFGKLNKVNFSIQIPKNISLNIPFSDRFRMSLYTKPQGGMFMFSNRDSVYYFNTDAKYFHFTRYEILSGIRFDAVFSKNFAAYIGFGTSSRNNITFYSESANVDRPRLPYKKFFYERNMKQSGFLNLGLVFRFGKTKSYFNDRNIYDAIDLNNTNSVGDNNISPGNTDIPIQKTIKRSKLNMADIQDLIDVNDN
jgi:hypothetical protein